MFLYTFIILENGCNIIIKGYIVKSVFLYDGNLQVHQKPSDLSISVGKSFVEYKFSFEVFIEGYNVHAFVYAKVKKGKNIEIV